MEPTPHDPTDPHAPDPQGPVGRPTDPDDLAVPMPPELLPSQGPQDDEPGVLGRLLVLGPIALVVAVCATAVAASIDRLDSALFFVGVPVVLALVVGLAPARSTGGLLFQVITVTLLFLSAFLHEGALCVLIVSPLLYGMGYFVLALMKLASSVQRRLAVVPLLALAAMEGVVPGTRINPVQESTATRVTGDDCASFVAGLDDPTFSAEDRGLLLRLAQYPTPTAADGAGLAEGDEWTLSMPAGAISTRVTERTGDATRGAVDFEVTEDTARTTRWVTLQDATLSWEQTDQGCRADVALRYERDLDPALYFGPITDLFMSAGARAFLTGLG